jgi:hypothetical protein
VCALACGCGPRPAPAVQTATINLPPPDANAEDAGTDAEAEPPIADVNAELAPAATPEEVAQRWLEALRRPSTTLLGEWSRYPFVLHDTGTEGTCGHGAAADPAQLARLLGCMLSNRPLLEELRATPVVPATPLKPKDLPAWARRWRAELAEETTPVLVEVAGHGNASHFVLLVFDGGVSALWKETVFQ